MTTTTENLTNCGPARSADTWSPAARHRIAALDRRSTRLVQRATDDARVAITYLGISPLFTGHQAYPGLSTDWIIGPVTDLSDAVIPHAEREKLVRLVRAGIEFPLIYIAHEIPKPVSLPTQGSHTGSASVTVTKEAAVEAVGPVPAPAGATSLATELGRASQHILTAIGKALPVAGAIAAAPIILAGAAIGALAKGLDPVVFGVIPAGPPVVGQPASWYILARWDWPATADYPA